MVVSNGKGKGKGWELVIAPLSRQCHHTGAQVHGAHQALYLPSRSRYSFTDPERMEGWVSPGPGCKEQLTHSCYVTARSQLDSNQWPRGCWSSALTTRLSCHPGEVPYLKSVLALYLIICFQTTFFQRPRRRNCLPDAAGRLARVEILLVIVDFHQACFHYDILTTDYSCTMLLLNMFLSSVYLLSATQQQTHTIYTFIQLQSVKKQDMVEI